MFYIRTNTSSRKVLKENVLLEEGITFVENSKEIISLMYKLPTGKGIKVFTNEEDKEYYLAIEGYPTRKTKNIIKSNDTLKNLYLEVKALKLEPNFNGKITIREKTKGSELALITKGAALDSVIENICIPLAKLKENKNIKLKACDEELCITKDSINESTDINKKDTINVELNLKEQTNAKESNCSKKSENSGKFISYNISGKLRSGSSVILSERIYDYKIALEKYNEAKELNSDNYNEICLNGHREDGSSSVRFKKTYESDVLSYEYISNFIKDLGERLKLLGILEKDAKSAMAIEDKRYNAAYHIMEVCDMDFDNPAFRENMLKMKIAADKRRDMKKTVHLLNTINNMISIPDTLAENIDNCINKIKVQSEEGIELYKDKSADDFVKEYEMDGNTINLGENAKSKLTVRPIAIEGKMVVYEKHYK